MSSIEQACDIYVRRHPADEPSPVKEWRKRTALFSAFQPLAVEVETVAKSAVPEPYQGLLVHNDHMTKMMERFHATPVDVHVIARRIDGKIYSREIVLTRQDTGSVIQFAIAQFNLDAVSEVVRQEILGEQVPLGRVLVQHGVNCQIELEAILKMRVGTGLSQLLDTPLRQVTYGRIARILCDDKPTFDVIEVSAPIPEKRFT